MEGLGWEALDNPNVQSPSKMTKCLVGAVQGKGVPRAKAPLAVWAA